ncbi:unnamed protein product [Rotaria sp. Silwood1]|nr:unnamed protein product [Rotaria sp. Silwood1]CAF4699773.1 unnamed protein product [Rotaria sp. Silwood1]
MTSTKDIVISSEQPVSSTTIVNQAEKYANYSFSQSIEYTTIGRSLGNTIYYNPNMPSGHNGYISSVSFRLFTNWKGTASLYLFIIRTVLLVHTILHRYAINPQKNTTQWQTFNIPSGALPIMPQNLLAVGMQDSSDTNQIYTVKSAIGMSGTNINGNTTKVVLNIDFDNAPALTYTVAYYDETTTMKPVTAH